MKYSIILLLLLSYHIVIGQERNSTERGINTHFSQTKETDVLYGVGEYSHFRNNFEIVQESFLRLEAFIGILERYDFMTANRTLQFSYGAKLELQLSPKSLFYISGQYVSNPFYQIDESMMPFDPFAPNSELGFGIEYQFNDNINLDIGNRTLIPSANNAEFNITPLNITRAKLKVKF